MKAIIDRKIYDTATANLVAHGSNGLPPTHEKYVYEELYRTKKGAYFIYNEYGYIEVISDGPKGEKRITDWLAAWKAQHLPERELAFLGIEEA